MAVVMLTNLNTTEGDGRPQKASETNERPMESNGPKYFHQKYANEREEEKVGSSIKKGKDWDKGVCVCVKEKTNQR